MVAGLSASRLQPYGGQIDAEIVAKAPDKHATIIILTNDDSADTKAMSDKITDRLMGAK